MKKLIVIVSCIIVAAVITFSSSSDARKTALNIAMFAEESFASMEKKSVVVDGHKIVYLERAGSTKDADVIVLLHGFTAEKNNWPRFVRGLKGDFRVIALDWPAHGESTFLQGGDYRIETQANRLVAAMDQLGLSKVHLVGNSMGGAIAANFASRFGERVITLTLMNAGGADNPKTKSEIEIAMHEGRNPLVVKKPEDFAETLRLSMEEPPFIPWPVSAAMAELAASRYERFSYVFGQVHGGVKNTNTDYLKKIGVPTLIMWGDKDRILDVSNAEEFRSAIPNSEVLIYPGIGHLPMLEVPADSSADIERFIYKHKVREM